MIRTKGGPHLAIFQDEAKAPGDGFEWAKGIRRISDPTEEQLGRGRRGRLPVRFVLVPGDWFALVERRILLNKVGNRRSH